MAQGRSLEGLWDLSVAIELGAGAGALALPIAGALRAGGLPEAAIRELAEAGAATTDPEARDLALARTYLATADADSALAVLRVNPSLAASPDGLLALALAADAAGQDDEAVAAMKRCRAVVAGRPDLRLALGRLALARGEIDTARADLDAAARDLPRDEAALYHAGLAHARGAESTSDAISRATSYLRRAVEVAPRSARAGSALGRLLYEREGAWEKAGEIYRQALTIDPGHLAAEEGLARVTARLGLPEALYHQARVREMTARPEEAVLLYRRWGADRPERWDSVLRAAECWLDLRRHTEAAREIEEGLKRFPEHIELYSHLAQIHLLANDRAEAARVCERWQEVDRASGRPERVRGKLALWRSDLPEAIRLLGEAVRKGGSVAAFHADLADALVRDPTPENLTRARDALRRAIDLEPGNPSYHSQLGSVLQQTGDLETARVHFLQALERNSALVEAYVGLAAIARRRGHPDTAARFARLERVVRDQQREEEPVLDRISRQPRDPGARLAAAKALLRRGALADAAHHLEAAVGIRPHPPEAASLLRRVQRLLAVE
jgi:tetratricopeptide (TPR) repeat protein